MSGSVRRLLLTIAVIPLVVIIGFQSAWAAFACTFDGQVRDRCCCANRDREEPVDATPAMTARCCCDITFHTNSDAPAARDAPRDDLAHVDVCIPTMTNVIFAPSPIERTASIQAMARPPPRVPLYLVKHSLLR